MSDRIYSVPARPQPLDVDLDTLRHQRGLSALKIGVCPARGSDAFVAVGVGATRPSGPRSRASIVAIWSKKSSKSNTSKFSAIRSGRADFGIAMVSCCLCQRRMTWATDFSCSAAIRAVAWSLSGSPLCPSGLCASTAIPWRRRCAGLLLLVQLGRLAGYTGRECLRRKARLLWLGRSCWRSADWQGGGRDASPRAGPAQTPFSSPRSVVA